VREALTTDERLGLVLLVRLVVTLGGLMVMVVVVLVVMMAIVDVRALVELGLHGAATPSR